MSLPLLLLLYTVSAATLVFFSIKCADYVDLLDKKTSISGAFIGGVILAAVTSLPELVTSISAIYVVDNAELIMGNVLGSNVFNLCIFGALTVVAVKAFSKAKVGASHIKVLLCTLAAYALTALTLFLGGESANFARIPVININLASLLILVVYAVSTRFLSADDSENDEEDSCTLTVRQIVVRFVLMALGLVVASIVVTFFTDLLAESLNLGASLAGAIFLGVATSLPELSSSVALVRRRNFNAMVGNVVGSNMFNFTIFSIADVIAGGTIVYFRTAESLNLLYFGALSSVLVLAALCLHRCWKDKEFKPVYGVVLAFLGVLVLASYGTSLVLSM